ncbi:MAG: site-specific tyrosine recombinase XerD [Actinomycetota bacterium]
MVNKELLQIFLNHCAIERGLSKNSVNAYRRDLEKFLTFLESRNLQLDKVQLDDLFEFTKTLRNQNLGEASIARKIVALRSFFTFLEKDQGMLNVSKELTPPKIPKRLPKALTVNEVSDLINSCDDSLIGVRNRAIIETLYATGARVSEVVALDLDDIGKSEDSILTVRVRGKGGKQRLVPLGSYAQQAIDQYLVRVRPSFIKRNNQTALFLNESAGTRLSRQSAWSIVSDAAQKIKLDRDISPHALRHSFATHLLDGGADIRVVQELLGHASVTTTQIYTLVTIDKLRESYLSAHPRSK